LSGKLNSSTLELERRQRNRPTAYVIAQQHSSATFVSLRFHYRKEKFDALSKHFDVSFFYFLKFLV
jgi:uncharacterized membrane protein